MSKVLVPMEHVLNARNILETLHQQRQEDLLTQVISAKKPDIIDEIVDSGNKRKLTAVEQVQENKDRSKPWLLDDSIGIVQYLELLDTLPQVKCTCGKTTTFPCNPVDE